MSIFGDIILQKDFDQKMFIPSNNWSQKLIPHLIKLHIIAQMKQ